MRRTLCSAREVAAGPVTTDRSTGTACLGSGRVGPPSTGLVEMTSWSFEGRSAVAALFRALGDPRRLSLVGFLAEAERCGTECAGHLGLSQGRTSAHLACLISCGIVSQRRSGRRVLYRVADTRALGVLSLGWAIAEDVNTSCRTGPLHAGAS